MFCIHIFAFQDPFILLQRSLHAQRLNNIEKTTSQHRSTPLRVLKTKDNSLDRKVFFLIQASKINQNQRSQTSTFPKTSKTFRRNLRTSPQLLSVSKRNPRCMRKCLTMGILHPAQCHFIC